MRRASRILTLIFVVVFLFGIFAGCGLVGKDVATYRASTVMTVGDQAITVGKLLDTFNSVYNQNYYMIAYGGWTLEDILHLAVTSLYTQAIKVEAYTKDSKTVTHTLTNADGFKNAQFLTQEQFNYTVSFVKYVIFDSFDANVLEKVEAKYELGDEEAEDKSRDFYEPDDLKGAATYAEYYLNQNFTNEDMDEYFEKYYNNDGSAFASSSKDLLELYLDSAQAKIDELNERIDEENDKILLEDYKKIQTAVYRQYANSVKNTYGIAFDKFVKLQVEDLISTSIAALYDYEIYKEIENVDGKMNEVLEDNYNTKKAEADANYELNPKQFEKFIEGLSSSDVIYTVPEAYENSYVFVKNILIPFSAKQSTILSSVRADLGTSKDEEGWYVKIRNMLAAEIVADDFNTTKDDDGKYGKLEEKPFKLDESGNVVINDECTALSSVLSGGAVTADDKDQAIRDLMARFNTDTAQHSSLYSYVVRVGEVPASYTYPWVDEFVDATKAAIEAGGKGHYGIGVSDYGVHIVYVEGYVEGQQFDFHNAKYLDTTNPLYTLFKDYFTAQRTKLVAEAVEKLTKDYKDEIKTTAVFKKFLKENKMEYDLVKRLNED